ncbi:hypothetical protein WJX82_002948 [Trebouxia sp. C0006]
MHRLVQLWLPQPPYSLAPGTHSPTVTAPEDVDAAGVNSDSDFDSCSPSVWEGPHGWDGIGKREHLGVKRRCGFEGHPERPLYAE